MSQKIGLPSRAARVEDDRTGLLTDEFVGGNRGSLIARATVGRIGEPRGRVPLDHPRMVEHTKMRFRFLVEADGCPASAPLDDVHRERQAIEVPGLGLEGQACRPGDGRLQRLCLGIEPPAILRGDPLRLSHATSRTGRRAAERPRPHERVTVDRDRRGVIPMKR